MGLAAAVVAGASGCATTQQPVTKIVNGQVIVTRAVSPEAYEHVTRALLYEEEERWDDAAAELQRALPFDDEAPEVRAHLAELFVRLGRLDDAAEQVEQSLRIEPTVDGWLASAHVREARGDATGQLESLRRAVEITRKDATEGNGLETAERAYLALADAQIVNLDIDGAYESCRQLVEIAPDTVRGRFQLAALAWARGALDEAEAVAGRGAGRRAGRHRRAPVARRAAGGARAHRRRQGELSRGAGSLGFARRDRGGVRRLAGLARRQDRRVRGQRALHRRRAAAPTRC